MALRTLGSLLTRRLATRAGAGAGGSLAGVRYSGGGGGDSGGGEASTLRWCVGRIGRNSASQQKHREFSWAMRRRQARRERSVPAVAWNIVFFIAVVGSLLCRT
uniref:Uncharacterized protein n=1 Tax=Oryza punctata TaxID=4537 RepID=A0A0E0L4B7_ORYPU